MRTPDQISDGAAVLTPVKSWLLTRPLPAYTPTCHAWTDGSFRTTSGLGWVITVDGTGPGPPIAEGARCLSPKQTAFDAEVAVIEAALLQFEVLSRFQHMVVCTFRLRQRD